MEPFGPVPLRLLRPKWLAEDGRERMGLELDCPRHPDGHRLQVWFANPGDGGLPKAGAGRRLWLANCCDMKDLTLMPASGEAHEPIRLCEHWRGWIIDGELGEVRIAGADEDRPG